jgi:heterodisulfide reductase subunit A-like polyferredoxin
MSVVVPSTFILNPMAQPVLANLTEQLGLNPVALGTKHAIEKQKLVYGESLDQYQERLKDRFDCLSYDRFAPSRDPIPAKVGTLIVGGGFGGVLTAVSLAQRGYTDIVILEKGAGYGGTWYWNQYPGSCSPLSSSSFIPSISLLPIRCSMRHRVVHLHAHPGRNRLHSKREICVRQGDP